MNNKELEQEAEKYARRFEEKELSGYNGESLSIEDRIEMEAFIAGATSKYVEKEKLKFAIEQLNNAMLKAESKDAVKVCILQIEELEQQLNNLQ